MVVEHIKVLMTASLKFFVCKFTLFSTENEKLVEFAVHCKAAFLPIDACAKEYWRLVQFPLEWSLLGAEEGTEVLGPTFQDCVLDVSICDAQENGWS